MKRKRVATGTIVVAIVGLLFNYFLWLATNDEVHNEPVETPFMASPEQDEGTASPEQDEGTASPEQDAITISRVVDGDTIKAMIEGEEKTIRIIGINTPETVDPRKPVECFGKEASNAAKGMLDAGEVIMLTVDATQDDHDKYGRLLRYVTDDSGQDVGLQLISQGYAYEYTYDVPYERQEVYKNAQDTARSAELGLWGDACSKDNPSTP